LVRNPPGCLLVEKKEPPKPGASNDICSDLRPEQIFRPIMQFMMGRKRSELACNTVKQTNANCVRRRAEIVGGPS
jgi:hypothetical protein